MKRTGSALAIPAPAAERDDFLYAVCGLLSTQIILMGMKPGSIDADPHACDDYSVGYIFGFINAGMQCGGTFESDRYLRTVALVFDGTFGSIKGSALFQRGTYLFKTKAPKMMEGMDRGFQDMYDLAHNGSEEKPAMGWADHVCGSRKKESEGNNAEA